MKKIIRLLLLSAVLMTCVLSLPVSAAVNDTLSKVDKKVRGFVNIFQYYCFSIPAEMHAEILLPLKVDVDGEERPIEEVSDFRLTEKDGEEAITIIPKKEEYKDAIVLSILSEYPFHRITEEQDSESGITRINVFLPGMTKDLFETYTKVLDAQLQDKQKKVALARTQYYPQILSAGGTDDDLNEFYKICNDAEASLDRIYEQTKEALQTRRSLYLTEHPEDGDPAASIFSGGSPAIVTGIAGIAVGMAVMFVLMKKRTARR